MAKKHDDKKAETIDVISLERKEVTVALIGETPLIFNRMAEKAKRTLVLPRAGRLTEAEKLANLKHDPVEEFRASPYRLRSDKEPTLFGVPAGAFKKSMAHAALDIPGAVKAQIGRLTRVLVTNEENLVPVWGIPYLKMDVTRSADAGRTPDVRTRACLKRWAAIVRISFMHPNLNQKAVVNLLSAAGQIIGVGDWRQEKGSGDFGSWRLTDADDPDFRLIVRDGGRAAQEEALRLPMPYDIESEDLLAWYTAELERRRGKEQEKKTAESEPKPRRKK